MQVPLEKIKHFTWELDIWRQVCFDSEKLTAFELKYVVPREPPEMVQAKKEERARRKEEKAEKLAAEQAKLKDLEAKEQKYKVLKAEKRAAKAAKKAKAKKQYDNEKSLQKKREDEIVKLTALKGTPQFTEEDQATLTKLEDLKRRRAESIVNKRKKQSKKEKNERNAKKGLPPLAEGVPEESLPAPPAPPPAPAAPVLAAAPGPRRRRREVCIF